MELLSLLRFPVAMVYRVLTQRTQPLLVQPHTLGSILLENLIEIEARRMH
jgi:hypothetical protein